MHGTIDVEKAFEMAGYGAPVADEPPPYDLIPEGRTKRGTWTFLRRRPPQG
jgi:hypothetical protein